MQQSFVKKHLNVGPGGIDCECCFPVKHKDRIKEFRKLCRVLKKFTKNEIDEEFGDVAELGNAPDC